MAIRWPDIDREMRPLPPKLWADWYANQDDDNDIEEEDESTGAIESVADDAERWRALGELLGKQT